MGIDLTSEHKLLPCPFCGSSAAPEILLHAEIERREHDEDEGNPDSYAVCCCVHEGGCGAVGGYEVVREKAAGRWNRRTATGPVSQHSASN